MEATVNFAVFSRGEISNFFGTVLSVLHLVYIAQDETTIYFRGVPMLLNYRYCIVRNIGGNYIW